MIGDVKDEQNFFVQVNSTYPIILGQKPVMPIEDVVPTWSVLPWVDGLSREELLALRIR